MRGFILISLMLVTSGAFAKMEPAWDDQPAAHSGFLTVGADHTPVLDTGHEIYTLDKSVLEANRVAIKRATPNREVTLMFAAKDIVDIKPSERKVEGVR